MKNFKFCHFVIAAMFFLGFNAHALSLQTTLNVGTVNLETGGSELRAFVDFQFTRAEYAEIGSPSGFQAFFLDSGNNTYSTSPIGGRVVAVSPSGLITIRLISSKAITNRGYIELKHIQVYNNRLNTGYLDGNPDVCTRRSGTACSGNYNSGLYRYTSKN